MVLRGSNISPKENNNIVWNKLIYGSISGVISRTIIAPIDRIKILIQTNYVLKKSNENYYNTIKNVIKKDGIKGYWKGNTMNCIRVMPNSGIQFSSYYYYKNKFYKNNNNLTIFERLFAGSLAGLTACTFTHPLDLIRIRLQTQNNVNTITQSINNIYKENGIKNFYKGYLPAVCSLTPFIAINFSVFDNLKTYIKNKDKFLLNKPYIILSLGCISGISAQTFCYPLDTIRRRSEVYGKNYFSICHAIKTIYIKEGIKGFYKGVIANTLKIIPNNFIRFFVFEKLSNTY